MKGQRASTKGQDVVHRKFVGRYRRHLKNESQAEFAQPDTERNYRRIVLSRIKQITMFVDCLLYYLFTKQIGDDGFPYGAIILPIRHFLLQSFCDSTELKSMFAIYYRKRDEKPEPSKASGQPGEILMEEDTQLQPCGTSSVSRVPDLPDFSYPSIPRDYIYLSYEERNILLYNRFSKRDIQVMYGLIELWDVSKVNNMSRMFSDKHYFNEPIGYWDVSSVTNMENMFYHASHFNQPLENWDVRNVQDMSCMFYGATKFNQPLGKWNVSNVSFMTCMFEDATRFNQSLESWDVSKSTEAKRMFLGATNFHQNIKTWKIQPTLGGSI